MRIALLRHSVTSAAAGISKYVLASFALTCLAFALPARAQDETPTAVTVQNRSGDLPFSASIGTDIEHVDVSSGNLIVHIPFTSVKGRGSSFDFGLNYDARYWVTGTRKLTGQGPSQLWNIGIGNYFPDATSGLGWQPTQSKLTWTNSKVSCSPSDQTKVARFQQHFIYQDSQGAKHSLSVRSGTGTCDTSSWTMVADLQGPDLSGTGMFGKIPLFSKTPAIYDASGGLVARSANAVISVPPPPYLYQGNQMLLGTSEDTDGNTLQNYVGGLDTLGRTIVTQSSGTNQVLYKIYDSSGTLQTYTVNYAPVSLHTTFNATDIYGAIQEYTGSRNAISSIVLPNGHSYLFQYETGTYGGLTRIDLPTGAYITYTWGTIYNAQDGDHAFRYVTSRTLHLGAQSFTWNFSLNCPEANSIGVICTNTVTDPLNQQSVYNVFDGAITTAKIYSGSATGTPLRQYDVTYANFGNEYQSDAEETLQLPTRATTTLENGLVSKKEFDYDTVNYSLSVCDDGDPNDDCQVDPNTGLLFTSPETSSRGNVVEMREFDWGTGAPGALLRRTKNAYLHDSNSNYLNANIVDKIITQNICNGTVSCAGTGDQAAQTQYEYDNYVAGDNPLQAATGAAEHDDTNYGTAFTLRGNATRVKHWRNTDGALLTTTYSYDTVGNIRAIKDPLGHSTTFDYTDSFANAACPPPAGNTGQAWVSTATNPLGQQLKVTRYPCTALVQAHRDQNDINTGGVGTTYVYDLLGRPTQKNNPDGGQSTTSYNDVPPVSVTSTTKINSTTNLVSTIIKDGLSRATQSQLASDPQGTDYTDTTYDALGRLGTVSNPYRSCATDPTSSCGTTTYAYDALNRTKSVTYADGSVATTVYCGPSTLATDPSTRWRRSRTDALGRLVEVDEPNSPTAAVNANGCPGSDPIWVTSYTLDAIGNLTNVLQNGSHARTFTYNSLSQLLTSSNPEVGTITYSYDANGNVLTKKDARIITTTYGYDALNRELTRTYSNGDLSVTTTYDQSACLGLTACQNIGHRTSATDAGGSEAWAYQVDKPNSRSVHADQRTNKASSTNITFTVTSYFDLAGNLTQLQYPHASGRVVNYTYDAADRPISAIDNTNGFKYATGWQSGSPPGCSATAVCYTPQGAIYGISFGPTSTFTGFNITNTYNNRLMPLEFKASSTAGNAIDITYNYVDPVKGGNAGHVFSVTNNLNVSRSQSFTYDQVNRITSAGTNATTGAYCWGYQYSYDAWGNLLAQAGWAPTYGTCMQGVLSGVTADGNNHISTFAYDASGNATSDSTNTYVWDGESQLKSAAGVTYLYDGDGRRVSKSNGKLYWYGPSGEIIAEIDATAHNLNDYIFFAGRHIGTQSHSGVGAFYVEDSLGSSRVLTTTAGVVCYDADFTPFGGERAYTNTCTQNLYKFEGKERDTETGNDEFGARYYNNRFGRWLSADWSNVPVAVPYANLSNPQTLNLYSMVADDPESFADLDGHADAWDNFVRGWKLAGSALSKAATSDYNYAKAIVNSTASQVGTGIGDIVAGAASDNDAQFSNGVNTVGSTLAPLILTEGESGMGMAEEEAPVTGFRGAGEADVTPSPGSTAAPTSGGTSNVPESIPAGPSARPTAAQQREINEMGNAHGCSTCGATNPGTQSGNWVGDHQPPTTQNPAGGAQVYKPQCLLCSRRQGGAVTAANKAAKKRHAHPR